MPNGRLELSVLDVYGDPVVEPVDVFLRHQSLAHDPTLRGVKSLLTIEGLYQSPQGLYSIEVDAPSYLAVSQFVNIPADGARTLAITLPVNKDRVVDVTFPVFANISEDARRLLTGSVVAGLSGQALYDGFDPLRKAGFLNLVTKAAHTRLANDQTVLSFLQQLTEQRGDRLFALVDPALHGEVATSATDGLVHPVPDALHVPPAGFTPVDSYKTPDHYGNLQLTFSRKETDWSVDMDIDDAQGFEHLFQVLHNAFTGQPTHPYNIHEILISYQELDPGYRFSFGTTGVSGRTTAAKA